MTLRYAEKIMNQDEQRVFLTEVRDFINEQVDRAVARRLADFGYRGVWTEGTEYKQGNFCTFDGSLFHCNLPTKNRPGKDPVSWSLCVKRGTDGKDGSLRAMTPSRSQPP
jgi:hypothetical protein